MPRLQVRAVAKWRPFCSKRCADVDLGRWMTGAYALPSTDPEDVDKAAEAIERDAASRDRQR